MVIALVLPRTTATTNVTCGSQFSWMDNSAGQSPCLLAATLDASCFTSGWVIEPVGSTGNYPPPNSSLATCCSCSWAVYNLVGACTACQDSTNIYDWNAYTTNCANYLTDTSFPTDQVVLLNHTLLPYWASINPTTWTDEKFNVTEAQAMHNSNHPDTDLSTSTITMYRSASVSIVAGGAVGAVIGAVLVSLAVFLYLNYRKKIQIHKRVVSNTSKKATRPASFAATRYAPTPVSTVYSSFSPSHPFVWTRLDQLPQSTMVQMSVQRANGAAMNAPENVISRFSFSSTTAPVDSNRRPDRRMDPIYETAEPASTRQLDRNTYDESVNNGREESVLLSSHSPIPSADRQGREYEPRRFYEFNDDNDGGAWEYRDNAANWDQPSWSLGAIWRRIWFR
ncbi:hypothetical protein F5887DRAFT_528882 [Amanita rubescens]|nr:hypothetical protein F5887DRAFT_528882 [Amanita rubescens]